MYVTMSSDISLMTAWKFNALPVVPHIITLIVTQKHASAFQTKAVPG